MRWEAQMLQADDEQPADSPGIPVGRTATLPLVGLQRSITSPQFADTVFHEVLAKSALNQVPAASSMPFRWTVNPYRGCTHACVYCYARNTHTYLDLDAGADFDQQIVVKVNIADVLKAEVNRPSWTREMVALGTNTDPYQRAEGRYQLMPGIIRTLADSGTPISLLTKGTLLKRDLPILKEASSLVPIQVGVSLALLEPALAARVEPGTPSPTARLKLIEKLTEAGAEVSVMAMPILPWLTDGEDDLESLFSAVRDAGAHQIQAGALHLRPGARQWYLEWIEREHPQLLAGYRNFYAHGSYAPQSYRRALSRRAVSVASRMGLHYGSAHRALPERPRSAAPDFGAKTSTLREPAPLQPSLFD
ncbi:Rv2578c family radical SAM protein [Citricoccus sp. NR2]|uniref:Rv2578c family radical SAM protein n=1 Tax=Citricoccus sp. NR2 TaxID=3004095 RepID=UPI0022DDEFFE|nr:Rv2578c family radical SAM protein [Citricoccus sp. NR2]WBL17997.1 Rv2578c family radical SAM protein [Citricoccus sp. NR2]